MSLLSMVRLVRILALMTMVAFVADCGPQPVDTLSSKGQLLSVNGDPQLQGEPKEEEGEPLEPVDAPDEDELIEESAKDIVPIPNPYGCFGRSDNPHRSTHIPSNVSAQGTTSCRVPVPWIYVRSSLYRSRWFWFDEHISTTQLGRSGTVAQVNPGGRCVDSGNYYVTSYHEVRGPDARLYWTRTSNSAYVNCR